MLEEASLQARPRLGSQHQIDISLEVHATCLFQPVIRVQVWGEQGFLAGVDSHELGQAWHWLPQGRYEFVLTLAGSIKGAQWIDIGWGTVGRVRAADVRLTVPDSEATAVESRQWALDPSTSTRERIEALPWQGGLDNWFFRHFDHAANVIAQEFLKDAPQLKGRILDVGAGDGITDLGIFLRYQPRELVALDIVDYINRLPEVATRHGLALKELPSNFVFVNRSAEEIPYADGYFDLIVSWGSVEHVKGGYGKVLDEIWRVLRPGGLFFVNPGLYFSSHGSHLGEFFSEPHHHLKMSEDAMRKHVLTHAPDRMDRSGFDVGGDEYWRFYKELNVIRVADFEQDLRRYGYRIIRGALRVSPMVEYDEHLQGHSLLDLACEDAFYVLEKPA